MTNSFRVCNGAMAYTAIAQSYCFCVCMCDFDHRVKFNNPFSLDLFCFTSRSASDRYRQHYSVTGRQRTGCTLHQATQFKLTNHCPIPLLFRATGYYLNQMESHALWKMNRGGKLGHLSRLFLKTQTNAYGVTPEDFWLAPSGFVEETECV